MTTIARDPLGTDRVPVGPSLSMFDPLFIGIDEFGHQVTLDTVYHNLLIAGEPGGGKSGLINLAAAQPALRAQSIAALGEELDRAEALGLDGLVMHPGSYTTGTEEGGLRLIAEGLAGLMRERPRARTMILLEHTAGQGTNLGHRFEHLAAILDMLDGSPRVGVDVRAAGGWSRLVAVLSARTPAGDYDRRSAGRGR